MGERIAWIASRPWVIASWAAAAANAAAIGAAAATVALVASG